MKLGGAHARGLAGGRAEAGLVARTAGRPGQGQTSLGYLSTVPSLSATP